MKKTLSVILCIILIISLSAVSVCAESSPFCTLKPETFDSASVILLEATTGTVIFEHNPDRKLPMASITKLMVLLIADEYVESGKLSLDETVVGTATAKATEGSRVYLDEGEEMSLEDILRSISIPSANDAAVALAEHISGSEQAFVELMNKKAKEMGLTNTHYVTASGLDAEGHYSTARDIATVSREIVLHHPRIMEHAKMTDATLRGGTFPLNNTNNLLYRYEYCTGLKTGTTDNAGYCLAATAEKNGVKLVAVLLGAPTAEDRFSEAKYLFEYAYSNFKLITVRPKGALVDDDENPVYIDVARGSKTKIPLRLNEDMNAFVPAKYVNKLRTETVTEKPLTAPVEAGTEVGSFNVYADDVPVSTQPLVTDVKLSKMNVFQAFWHILKAWLSF